MVFDSSSALRTVKLTDQHSPGYPWVLLHGFLVFQILSSVVSGPLHSLRAQILETYQGTSSAAQALFGIIGHVSATTDAILPETCVSIHI